MHTPEQNRRIREYESATDEALALLRAFQGMEFGVEKSKRYHTERAFHHQTMAVCFQVVELCASSAVLFNWLSAVPTIQHAVLGLSAIVAGLALVHQCLKAQAWHMEKKGAFSELAKLFPVDLAKGDEALYERIRNAREEIEKTDGKLCECLDVRCHNEECLSRGWPEQCYPLTWWQRNVLVYLNVGYRGPVRPTSSATEAEARADEHPSSPVSSEPATTSESAEAAS